MHLLREGRASVIVLTVFVLGCGPEPAQMPSFEWQGQWIEVHGYERDATETCEGSLAYLDTYAGVLADEFGVDAPLGLYQWYSEDLFEELDPCAFETGGCTGSNGVFSSLLPLEHELVHLAEYRRSPCPVVISEGLAEHYGTTGRTAETRDIGSLLLGSPQTGPLDPSAYPVAAAFVAYLVENHGLEAVLSMCAEAGVAPEEDELSAAMSSAFGLSLEQVISDFDSAPTCSYDQQRSKLFECSQGPAVVVSDEAVEIEFDLDCSNERTIGPRWGEIWVNHRVEVLETGTYLVELNGLQNGSEVGAAEGVSLEVSECASCSADPQVHRLSGGELLAPLQLSAGLQAIEVRAPAATSASFLLRFTRVQ